MKRLFFLIFTLVFFVGTSIPFFAIAKIPNDPKVQQWAYKDIGVYHAWDLTTGSSDVVVAVVDNGFDANHPDLKNNVWKNKNEIANNGKDDDKNGYIDDVSGWNFVPQDLNKNGRIDTSEKLGNNNPVPNVDNLSAKDKEFGYFHHGTLVAGLIGASGNNKKAGSGLNWKVKLMNLKVLENGGVGDFAPLARAIRYAVDNGADIINVSAVGSSSKDLIAAVDYAYEKGVVIVAAAGNNAFSLNEHPLYPACVDKDTKVEKVLGVSAIDESHRLANFSNFGDDCIDITAPGVNIGSSMRYAPEVNLQEMYQSGWSGTSFSAPIVSGAAALIKSIQPDWKAQEIYDALKKTAHKTPPKDELAYANSFGVGLLQVDKAVEYAFDRLPSSRVFSDIVVFDRMQGSGTLLKQDKTVVDFSKTFLRKVDFLASYKVDGGVQYFALRSFAGQYQATTYDSSWKKLSRFTIPQTGKFHFVFGNFRSANEPTLLLIPQNGQKNIFAYGVNGKELFQEILPGEDQIQSVRLIAKAGSKTQNLAFITIKNKEKILTILDENFKAVGEKISLTDFDSVSDLAAGDIDGDKKIEYVVAGKIGPVSKIFVLNTKGELKKEMTVDQTASASEMILAVGDFNDDKKEDIALYSTTLSILSIFDGSGKKIGTYPIGSKGTVHNFQILPSFK